MGNLRENVAAVTATLPPQLAPGSPELHSLLGLVAAYMEAGETAVFYPKLITDRVLLARTDFATLFKMLPKNEQDWFRKTPRDFVALALVSAQLGDHDPNKQVITKVWTDENMTDRHPVGPTRERWLWFMTQGYDLLSSLHYRELASSYADRPEEARLGTELESLGEMGARTEEVGAARQQGGIFELRSAALSRTKLPLLQWEPFTAQVMRYLIALENGAG